jgi:hypothetical protein
MTVTTTVTWLVFLLATTALGAACGLGVRLLAG